MKKSDEVPHSRENAVSFFLDYASANQATLTGKNIVDLSAGSGFIANEFKKRGGHVQLYDLFPDQNTFCSTPCVFIDLQGVFPIDTGTVDLAICAETIEHLPNQFFFFEQTSRILKKGATLIVTSPNSSSLRSRFSQFLMESEHYAMPAPNELNAFTRWEGQQEGYFSKLFISGALRLRTLAALHGLRIRKIHRSPASSTSYFLMIFYPIIYFFAWKTRRRQLRENPSHAAVYNEIFDINTSGEVLTSKHLIMEFEKR